MTNSYINELDKICVLDLETSGTDQQTDQILEIHAKFGSVNTNGFTSYVSYNYVFPLISDPKKWDPFVVKMHTNNGLLEECRKISSDNNHFEKTDEYLVRIADGNKYTLMGNTVHFDLGFVKRVFPLFGKTLSHRVLDVSGARLFCQSLGMPYPGKPQPAHRAKDDCEQSIECYSQYQNWMKNLQCNK